MPDFTGGDGNDVFDVGPEADSASGGAGDDGLIGGCGADTLYGLDGSDVYVVDGNKDQVVELPGQEDIDRLAAPGPGLKPRA